MGLAKATIFEQCLRRHENQTREIHTICSAVSVRIAGVFPVVANKGKVLAYQLVVGDEQILRNQLGHQCGWGLRRLGEYCQGASPNRKVAFCTPSLEGLSPLRRTCGDCVGTILSNIGGNVKIAEGNERTRMLTTPSTLAGSTQTLGKQQQDYAHRQRQCNAEQQRLRLFRIALHIRLRWRRRQTSPRPPAADATRPGRHAQSCGAGHGDASLARRRLSRCPALAA